MSSMPSLRSGLFLFVGLLLWFSAAGAAHAEPVVPSDGLFAQPAQALRDAPDFATHIGEPAIVILFQPECAWCQIQFKESAALIQDRPDINIVAISLKGTRRDLLKELRSASADLPAYRSSPAVLEALLNPKTTPLVYLVDSKGALRYAGRGLHKRDKLEQMASLVD